MKGLVYFCVIIISCVSICIHIIESQHVLTKNKLSSGFYFKHSGTRTQALRRYDIFFDYNFPKFAENLEEVISDLEQYLTNFEKTEFFIPEDSDSIALSRDWVGILQHQKSDMQKVLIDFEKLKNDIFTIADILKQKHRKKRALLELGSIFSSLIGVASNAQILEISERISSLESHNKQVNHFITDSMSVFNSTYINIVENREQIYAIQDNNRFIFEQIFNDTSKLGEILNTLAQVTIIYNQNLAFLQKANKMFSAFSRRYDTEINNIAALANNKLSTALISPMQLFSIINGINKLLPSNLGLPYKVEKQNMLKFYGIIKCNVAKSRISLHVMCSIPLLETTGNFDLFMAYPLQLRVQNVSEPIIYTRHRTDVQYFLISSDLTKISILTYGDYEKCKLSPTHFCNWNSATLNTISVEKSCVIQIYLTDKLDPSLCSVEIIKHPTNFPVIENIVNNYFIIQYFIPIKWNIICMSEKSYYITTKRGFDIIRMQKSCHAVSKFAILPELHDIVQELILDVEIIQNQLKQEYWPHIYNILKINTSSLNKNVKHLRKLPHKWTEIDRLNIQVEKINLHRNKPKNIITWNIFDFFVAISLCLAIVLLTKLTKYVSRRIYLRLIYSINHHVTGREQTKAAPEHEMLEESHALDALVLTESDPSLSENLPASVSV